MEKDIPCKWKSKESWSSNSHILENKDLFDPPPRVMEIKTKINKWDLMKRKSFCTEKETINQMKRQPSESEKIFASINLWLEATDKGLISNNKPQKFNKMGIETYISIITLNVMD